ncbi:MAG TPA: FkbM family methyltransferase [Alphaproteobacteria bacterium]|nr:FkbM family methyltransferase [Alphaproteobacteria bacterium]
MNHNIYKNYKSTTKKIYWRFRSLVEKFFTGELLLREGDTDMALSTVYPYLSKEPVIVEAGAFDGGDTIKIATKWPYSRIYAFEPVDENFDRLVKTTADYPNIRRYKLALSESNGKAIFYHSFSKTKPDRPAAGSLLVPREHLEYAPHVEFNRTSEVETITLDSWAKREKIDSIDFLWLDMQGMEFRVLKNAPNVLKSVRVIYTEVEFVEAYEGQQQYAEIRSFLENMEFVVLAKSFTKGEISNPKRTRKWFGNVVFVKKSLLIG